MPETAVDVEVGDAPKTPVRLEKTGSSTLLRRKRPIPAIPRMVRRDLPAFQSSNRFHVKQRLTRSQWWLLRHDWFHILLNQPAPFAIFVMLTIWTLMILVFAAIYAKIDRMSPEQACGLGQENKPIVFSSAFAFSLETCTTVGKFCFLALVCPVSKAM